MWNQWGFHSFSEYINKKEEIKLHQQYGPERFDSGFLTLYNQLKCSKLS